MEECSGVEVDALEVRIKMAIKEKGWRIFPAFFIFLAQKNALFTRILHIGKTNCLDCISSEFMKTEVVNRWCRVFIFAIKL
jgi:hypothetical protein